MKQRMQHHLRCHLCKWQRCFEYTSCEYEYMDYEYEYEYEYEYTDYEYDYH